MSSYVVVGASRGLGFEYLRQLSENPENIVVGLVRNVQATRDKVAAEIDRPNVHIFYSDLSDYKTLPGAVEETSKVTGGKLDVLIANAAVGGDYFDLTLSELGSDPEKLEKDLTDCFRLNVVAQAHAVNAFMPLVLLGKTKKVIVMTTGMADVDLVRKYDLWMGVGYCASKAALNMIIAKFSAEYREKGVLFLGISPGVVDTSASDTNGAKDAVNRASSALGAKLLEYEPEWKGPIQTEESIKKILSVTDKATAEDGNAGDFVSHLGNKRWV
ncbi:uncharacterized protein F5Z01DRAFT_750292 [Emericellopsis atlantica]|uniref:NAD(P)-binding protein n=1 Tax=Emericellopsis atlantica TaxID=2614577 RepID=A0A9P7ZMF7_9HYPO|nr:uncharacterized protein F5Z01DRAFT_750292 [Emericellopsis atlantica]KAG9254392.1 hypothetical protein F5Z01DRAFT_750292 [Emericellopsis atlantica]